MQKLYIVRHGKTDWNIKGLIQGTINIPLNEQGIKEANELKKLININEIDICISSPLKRAKETAKIITENKIDIILDDKLIERGFGDYEGKNFDIKFISSAWDYKNIDKTNNIEDIITVLNRGKEFLDKIKKEYPNKNILIVSHAGFIKSLHYNIEGYNKDTDFLSFSPKNTTLYKYEIN